MYKYIYRYDNHMVRTDNINNIKCKLVGIMILVIISIE